MTDIADGTTVTCPECGTVSPVHPGQRLASDFCPSCDYPLFWARPSAVAVDAEDSDEARRRAPGTSGTAAAASLACPSCAELNLPTAVVCVRCGASMLPPPPAAEPPLPEPQPVVVVQPAPPPEPCGHPATWLVVLVTAVASVALTLLVVWLV